MFYCMEPTARHAECAALAVRAAVQRPAVGSKAGTASDKGSFAGKAAASGAKTGRSGSIGSNVDTAVNKPAGSTLRSGTDATSNLSGVGREGTIVSGADAEQARRAAASAPGNPINEPSADGQTPLLQACANSVLLEQLCLGLLEQGALPNVANAVRRRELTTTAASDFTHEHIYAFSMLLFSPHLNTHLGDGRNATDAGRPVGKRSSGARIAGGRSLAERARQAEPARGSLRGRERRAGDARAALRLRRELRPDGHEGQHADARGGGEGPADGVPLSRAARLQLEGEERRGRDGAHAGQVGRPEGVHEGVPQGGSELRALCRRGRDPRRHRSEAQRAVGHPPLRLRCVRHSSHLCIDMANSLSISKIYLYKFTCTYFV